MLQSEGHAERGPSGVAVRRPPPTGVPARVPGATLAVTGLVIALTAGALVSLYVEQVSAIASTLVHAAILLGIVHFRNRFLADGAGDGGADSGVPVDGPLPA